MGKLNEYMAVSQRGFFPTRVLTRPIASLMLAAIPDKLLRFVTPNRISFSAFWVAQLANLVLVMNFHRTQTLNHRSLFLWVVIHYFSYVLDCADGQFARRNNQTSIEGKILDMVLDFARELSRFLLVTFFLIDFKWGHYVILYLALRLFWMSTWASINHLDTLASSRHPVIQEPVSDVQKLESKTKRMALTFLSLFQDGFVDIFLCAFLLSWAFNNDGDVTISTAIFFMSLISVLANIFFVFRRILR